MEEPVRSDHPNPLKRVGFAHGDVCPNCGCRLSLERIQNEIEATKRLAKMRARERAREAARQAAQPPGVTNGVMVLGANGAWQAQTGAAIGGSPVHTLNFGAGMKLSDTDIADKSYIDHEPMVTLTSRTCAECGTRYEPDFAGDRERLLDELARARMEGMSAIDLLGDLVANDEG